MSPFLCLLKMGPMFGLQFCLHRGSGKNIECYYWGFGVLIIDELLTVPDSYSRLQLVGLSHTPRFNSH